MFEFADIGGRSVATIGNVEEFGCFYACGDLGIANQARTGIGDCVANFGRYGAIKYSTLDLGFCERFSKVCAF